MGWEKIKKINPVFTAILVHLVIPSAQALYPQTPWVRGAVCQGFNTSMPAHSAVRGKHLRLYAASKSVIKTGMLKYFADSLGFTYTLVPEINQNESLGIDEVIHKEFILNPTFI